jgi:hypothetical protein
MSRSSGLCVVKWQDTIVSEGHGTSTSPCKMVSCNITTWCHNLDDLDRSVHLYHILFIPNETSPEKCKIDINVSVKCRIIVLMIHKTIGECFIIDQACVSFVCKPYSSEKCDTLLPYKLIV